MEHQAIDGTKTLGLGFTIQGCWPSLVFDTMKAVKEASWASEVKTRDLLNSLCLLKRCMLVALRQNGV